MAIKQVIATSKAPQPPNDLYSQGIVSNGMVYCSGSVGLDPDTGILVDGDIRARTHRCLKNLTAVLEAAGSSLENVVKVNIYLTSMEDYAAMNSAYLQYWPEQKPCRTCIAVKELPRGTDVEIECVAALPSNQ